MIINIVVFQNCFRIWVVKTENTKKVIFGEEKRVAQQGRMWGISTFSNEISCTDGDFERFFGESEKYFEGAII